MIRGKKCEDRLIVGGVGVGTYLRFVFNFLTPKGVIKKNFFMNKFL